MRTVFDNSMVAHVWAQQNQRSGRNAKDSFSFAGGCLYSYRTAIAQFVKPDVVLISNRSYSQTTSKHQSYMRRALSNQKKFYVVECRGLGVADDIDHPRNVNDYEYRLNELVKKCSRAKSNLSWLLGQLQSLAMEQADYIKTFKVKGLKAYKLPKTFDVEALKAKASEIDVLEASKREAEAQAAEELRKKQERAAKRVLKQWQAGENVQCRYSDEKGYRLRIKPSEPNVLQTTGGAEVPLDHAMKLLPIIRKGKEYSPDGVRSIRLGHFVLNSIDKEGNLTVGCHRIPREEIDRLATQLGV
jgi:hypothetical protein